LFLAITYCPIAAIFLQDEAEWDDEKGSLPHYSLRDKEDTHGN